MNKCAKHLKNITFVIFATISAIYVIVSNVRNIDQLKSQSLIFNKLVKVEYQMNSRLLPLHQFSIFDKTDVSDRFECVVNQEYQACKQFCIKELKNDNQNQI